MENWWPSILGQFSLKIELFCIALQIYCHQGNQWQIGDIHTSHHSQLEKQVNIIEQQNNIIEGNIIQSCGGIL